MLINLEKVGEWTDSDLCKATDNGDVERTKFLMKYGSNIEGMNARKMTPLHFASKNGHEEVCKLIIEEIQDKNPGQKESGT